MKDTRVWRRPLCITASLGRGDDRVGTPHPAQIGQLELVELKFLNSSFSSLSSLMEIRQIVPCRAIRAHSISVSSTFPPSFYNCPMLRSERPWRLPHIIMQTSDCTHFFYRNIMQTVLGVGMGTPNLPTSIVPTNIA